tara:strand:- start:2670 stop:3626 length:957 start_codon:yes stop_codon:yes gene_type:complete
MVEYLCYRCGYIGKQKCHLFQHLNRKNVCKPIIDNIDVENIKNYYGFIKTENTSTKIHQNPPKYTKIHQNNFHQNPPKSTKNAKNIHQNPPKSTKIHQNHYFCEFCNNTFSRSDSLNRHYNRCKIKKQSQELIVSQNEEIKQMKTEIEELKKIKIHNNITNNTNNTNNSNNSINNSRNIIINNYGDENIKHLRSKDYASLLNGIYSAVPKLIQQIHFDPEHPENQNIKFTNKKLPYLKVMKDDKWQFVDKKTELLDLIDNKCFLLREKYYNILEKNKYNITDNQKNIIDKFLDKYEEDDKQVLLDIINKTELVLINNS